MNGAPEVVMASRGLKKREDHDVSVDVAIIIYKSVAEVIGSKSGRFHRASRPYMHAHAI